MNAHAWRGGVNAAAKSVSFVDSFVRSFEHSHRSLAHSSRSLEAAPGVARAMPTGGRVAESGDVSELSLVNGGQPAASPSGATVPIPNRER